MGNPDSDLKEWHHILETLKWYGQEGMSPEESSVKDIKEIYHLKVLPWHRQEVDAYMDILDKTRRIHG